MRRRPCTSMWIYCGSLNDWCNSSFTTLLWVISWVQSTFECCVYRHKCSSRLVRPLCIMGSLALFRCIIFPCQSDRGTPSRNDITSAAQLSLGVWDHIRRPPGCIPAEALFCVAIDWICVNSMGTIVGASRFTDPDYVDDVRRSVLWQSRQVATNTHQLRRYCAYIGLAHFVDNWSCHSSHQKA